ncbi:hypothetical protein GCM10027589_49310 [Actinocorallia lasiicapitis]
MNWPVDSPKGDGSDGGMGAANQSSGTGEVAVEVGCSGSMAGLHHWVGSPGSSGDAGAVHMEASSCIVFSVLSEAGAYAPARADKGAWQRAQWDCPSDAGVAQDGHCMALDPSVFGGSGRQVTASAGTCDSALSSR